MIITLHYKDKEKRITANDLAQAKQQIILNFYMEFYKLGMSKEDSYKATAKEVGLAYDTVKRIILDYQKDAE